MVFASDEDDEEEEISSEEGGGEEKKIIIWQVKSNYFDMCEMLTTGWASRQASNNTKPGWRMLWRKWMMSDDDNELTGLCDPHSLSRWQRKSHAFQWRPLCWALVWQ